ncbi:DUF373 family protein [Candidatus Micrarchaeota archaeon]|nr:DUF373 family protein [Candidatus Micrarchaeota archaeon]
MSRPILIICIDRDNDVYEKAGFNGPIIGRENNLKAAIGLSLSDPEDPDSNSMFYAIKTYDQLCKDGINVEVVTLTGDKELGFKADRNISAQLERIITELSPASSILISDGPADEEILPIIKSRLKVDSTRVVFIKQAKELEKTYFVLLEKLKDPYYARIMIGIPALLILLTSLSSYLGLGWQPVGILIGLYLLMKISGLENLIFSFLKDFRVSLDRTSWVGYLASLAIFLTGIFVAYQSLHHAFSANLRVEKVVFYAIGNTVWIFFIGFIFLIISKILDALNEKKRYEAAKYLLYFSMTAISTFVLFISSLWIVNLSEPYVDFGTFLVAMILAIVVGYLSSRLVHWYRSQILKDMKLEGKEVISNHGSYIGKIVGFDSKRGQFFIQTMFDKRLSVAVSEVLSIDDRMIIKSEI